MRLLDAKTRRMKEFMGDENVPPYAILSHTWGEDEVAFDEIHEASAKNKFGYAKIAYCCEQAVKDKLDWVWIDTCCIDKSSSAELSEAINSMFRWYRKAVTCYVYLSDYFEDSIPAEEPTEFAKCRWFTRGWTLQELLAPKNVTFYSATWKNLGSKDVLCSAISQITGIEAETLQGEALNRASVARRMSWAAKRTTTRTEDLAYCLLGIFDVNLPLLYGEGGKAFFRLQEEIMRSSSDQSLFAWGESPVIELDSYLKEQRVGPPWEVHEPFCGLLAESPSVFEYSGDIDSLNHWELERQGWEPKPVAIHNKTIHVDLPVIRISGKAIYTIGQQEVEYAFAVLGSRPRFGYAIDYANFIGIPLQILDTGMFVRCDKLVLVPKTPYLHNPTKTKAQIEHLSLAVSSRIRWDFDLLEQLSARYFLRPKLPFSEASVYLSHVHCGPSTSYDRQSGMIWSHESSDSIAAYFFFKCNKPRPPFSVVIYTASLWHKGDGLEFTLFERINVRAKLEHHDYDPSKKSSSSFMDALQRDDSSWERLAEPDTASVPNHQGATGRSMKLVLSSQAEVVIFTQWLNWHGKWREDLTIDVINKASVPSEKRTAKSLMVEDRPRAADFRAAKRSWHAMSRAGD